MPKRKHTAWEISFYIALSFILVWLVLKMTGAINTLHFIEYGFPILSATYAFFALYRDLLDRINRIGYGLTKTIMKVEPVGKEVEFLKLKN